MPTVNTKQDASKKRKRGRRGGVKNRLRRRPAKPPLPSVVFANVQSLYNKIDELHAKCRYDNVYREACVMAFCETWLDSTRPDDDIILDGDGTMVLARTSGHDLANTDNMAVFWSRRKQLELRKTLQVYVYLQIHQPMADRKSECIATTTLRLLHGRRHLSWGNCVANLQTNSVTKEKAEILLDQFQSVFTRDGGSAPPHLDPPQHPIISDININTAGVCKLLKAINPHKACGPDQIPNVILKNCADTLAPSLRDIFQRSLDTAVLPSDWRTANVSAVFKKGDKHLPENYRPISFTSVPCKILEHIIYRHLMTYLEEHTCGSNTQ
ncbi:hypothetical protein NP493_175g02033 [Ridgeia piscesae]|uniref:Uncharacterized protein n=1 Tax=Ridgeia piscesae TaxID=27915 RepID=A0AAD9P316_RIDPI|nr:hypothetical protein NP493_175g02033 [Ridgeia piscesae]